MRVLEDINQKRMEEIKKRLSTAFDDITHLEIIDESHLHVGHVGAKSGKGHFAVSLSSPAFEGKTKIAQWVLRSLKMLSLLHGVKTVLT